MTSVREAMDLRTEIASIFADVFEHDEPLEDSTSSEDVARWDSLSHIALVRSIEQSFDVTLTMDEMLEIRSVADIERVLTRHGI